MKITAITPVRVDDDELARRQKRYRRLSPDGVDIELLNLRGGDETPVRLETADDIRHSDRLVAETALSRAGDGTDAFLPDCVLDPAVDALEREGVPVLGILRLCTGFLAACGRPFAAVTRNEAIGHELMRRVGVYGFEGWFDRLVVLDLDFEAITNEHRWHDALDAAQAQLTGGRAEALVNGCSAVEVPSGRPLPVVDPTALALRLIGVAARTGLAGPARAAAPAGR